MASESVSTLPPSARRQHQPIGLNVRLEQRAKGAILHYRLRDGRYEESWPREIPRDPADYRQSLYESIERLLQVRYCAEAPGRMEHRLAGIGNELAELLPEALLHKLWSYHDPSREETHPAPPLQLFSDEPWIPWELLRLPNPEYPRSGQGIFLAEAFALTRSFRDCRQTLTLPLRHIGLVVPDSQDLPKTAEEKRLLHDLEKSSERQVTDVDARSDALFEGFASGRFDAWHFAALGRADSDDPERFSLCLDDGDLVSEDLNLCDLCGELPLIFLNACYSARVGLSITGIGGLAYDFLRAGAGAVIGASWLLDDKLAPRFAEAFYDFFLRHALPIGEASRRARLHVRAMYPGDPTWLAYTVFAHPMAAVTSVRWRIFLRHAEGTAEAAKDIAERLGEHDLEVRLIGGGPGTTELRLDRQQPTCYAIVAGAEPSPEWLQSSIDHAINRAAAHRMGLRIAVFLRPGREHSRWPADIEVVLLDDDPQRRAQALDKWSASLRDLPSLRRSFLAEDECPFPGLEPYDESRARFFFGRNTEIEALVKRLGPMRHGRRRWLQIEGASGAGKSSLARAGLIPAVIRGDLRGAEGSWRVLGLRPGRNPMRNLAYALEGAFAQEGIELLGPAIEAHMRRDEHGLRDLLRRLRQSSGRDCLLLVDQLEELFTLTDDTASWDGFDTLLAEALEDLGGPLYLVTTIRNDFIPELSKLRRLSHLLNDRAARFRLEPMLRDGLAEVLSSPPHLAGLKWQPSELPQRILSDALNAPGGLPLMSYTLRMLWQQRDGGFLRAKIYDGLGGLGGALTQSADALIAQLGETERIRDLFLALVRVGHGTEDTRRVITRRQALAAAGGGPTALRILTELSGGRARGTFEHAPLGPRLIAVAGAERVELAHEELLRSWRRLKDWIQPVREALEIRDHLEHDAAVWETRGCPENGLPSAGLVQYFERAHSQTGRAQRFLAAAQWRNRRREAISDGYRLAGLQAEVDRLWPADSAMIPSYERWLDSAREHLSRLPLHRQTLARFRQKAIGPADSQTDHWAFDDPDDSWWHGTLIDLVDRLETLENQQQGLIAGTHPDYGWGIERRLRFARTIEQRSLTNLEAARTWQHAIAAIADPDICPAYGGLEVRPQLGLLPVGRDPRSGLWEFAHLHSGEVPERDSTGTLRLDDSTAIVLVLLPADSFWMGAQKNDPEAPNYDPDAATCESPVHRVTLEPFFLAKLEMTQAQWTRAQGSNPAYWSPQTEASITLRNPVENISWQDCKRILQRIALQLPTEAQWEYACRANTHSTFYCGQTLEGFADYGNVKDQAYARVVDNPGECESFDSGFAYHAPVGSLAPNAFGFHDMHGNVWEWCRDAWAEDYSLPCRSGDGLRLAEGRHWVTRGGSFWELAARARSAHRDRDPINRKAYHLSVRPARKLR